MIDPTHADIGRRVIYRSRGGETVEVGIVTGFNEHVVWVLFNAGDTPTMREDLEWVPPRPERKDDAA